MSSPIPTTRPSCAGGTFAKYASAGAEVCVVSFTRGGAGQIRDAALATRATLPPCGRRSSRPPALSSASPPPGAWTSRTAVCAKSTADDLLELAAELIDEFDPDVVVTFGPDGFSGHPDHVAVGAAVTAACFERRSARPIRLFHCHLPRSRMLLRDRLAEWVVELTTRFKGTEDFVRALSVFSRETTSLGFAADFVDVEWFPAGSYLIEQGEAATTMYFLLSGQVEIRREGEDGRVRVVDRSGPGEFIGEEGIATGRPRNAHVVAVDDVTSLTFLAAEPLASPEAGRGRLLRHRIAAVGRPDRRPRDHLHRRFGLRRPQDPGHGCPPHAVPDRPRACSPTRSSGRCSASSTSSRSCRSAELDTSLLDDRPRARDPYGGGVRLAGLQLRRHVVEQGGREVPLHPVGQHRAHVVPGAEAGGQPPRRRDVEPARRADAQAATAELARRSHGFGLRAPARAPRGPTASGSRSRLMPSTTPGIPPTTSGVAVRRTSPSASRGRSTVS